MEPKTYATAAAFRRALEDRLQDIARREGVDLQRLRRQVAFDRLLARLFQGGEPRTLLWVLKGGYAMELRIKAARTTKDVDLTMRSASSSVFRPGGDQRLRSPGFRQRAQRKQGHCSDRDRRKENEHTKSYRHKLLHGKIFLRKRAMSLRQEKGERANTARLPLSKGERLRARFDIRDVNGVVGQRA